MGERWPSSHTVQNLLRDLGCELESTADSGMVNVYNPVNNRVVTMQNSGHIAPQEFRLILARLRLTLDG